jgi:antibiotic biosynthesis monooxygenase (ABM) superfamily enzyme
MSDHPATHDATHEPRLGVGPELGQATAPDTGHDASDTVTAVVERTVQPGREHEFAEWVRRLISAAEQFPNNLGTVMFAPAAGSAPVYRLVHRFVDRASLEAWEQSAVRRQLSSEADAFSTSTRQIATGMDAWFDVADSAMPAPRKWKMALVTFVVVYGLTSVIIPLEMAWIPDEVPFYIVNILTNALVASLLTWVILPAMGRVLGRWLVR